jgi:hypothetical protein
MIQREEREVFDKAPSDAIAAFLARPGGFFSWVSKAQKTAPENILSGYVMRYFVMGFVMAAIRQSRFAVSFLPYTPSHN